MDCLKPYFPDDIIYIIVKKLLPYDLYDLVMEEFKNEITFQDTIRIIEPCDNWVKDSCYKGSFISLTSHIFKYYNGIPVRAFFPDKYEKITIIEYYKNLLD